MLKPYCRYRLSMTNGGSVELAPITRADLGEVGGFLHANLNPRLSTDQWAAAIVPTWSVESPNHGFLLREAGAIVGVYLAFYSERHIAGQVEQFCNLGAWCVLEGHRAHGVRLIRAVLGQKGYHFTDLSPSGNVVPLNKRLKFVELDTSTVLVPNLPWPVKARGVRIVSDPAEIEQVLTGDDRVRFRDHRSAKAARQLVLVEKDGTTCHVIFRKDRRKNLPLFASILHVSNREVFARRQAVVFRHLLRHGVAATLAEVRVLGHAPRGGRPLKAPRTKMFRSATLKAEDVDYLYSELTCVAW
jgi:hypothetical protein